MPGDPMDGTSQRMAEDRAPLCNLPELLDHGSNHHSPPPDPFAVTPSLAQDIPDNYTARSLEFEEVLTTNYPFEPPNGPVSPHYDLSHQALPQVTSGYVSIEDYERAMKHNAKLSQELMRTKREAKKANLEAEQAKIAFRALAGWAYRERKRSLDGLPGTRLEEHIRPGHQQIEGMAKHHSRATDVGNAENSGGDEEYEPPEVLGGSSLDEQIDQLIAEEKGKVSLADF